MALCTENFETNKCYAQAGVFFLAKICTLKTIINVVSKVMRYCIGLALLRSFIGSKNSLQTRSKKQMLN